MPRSSGGITWSGGGRNDGDGGGDGGGDDGGYNYAVIVIAIEGCSRSLLVG